MDGGEPDRNALLQRGPKTRLLLRLGRPRHLRDDERHRVVHQHTRRLALAVADDPSAGRIRSGCADAASAQSLAVHPGGMTVDAGEVDRRAREQRVQLLPGRKVPLPLRPGILIPAPPHQPLALIARRRRGLRQLENLLDRRGPGEVQDGEGSPQTCEVRVRVRQARNDGGPAQLDDAHPGMRSLKLPAAADRDHLAPPGHQGLGERLLRQQRPHPVSSVEHGLVRAGRFGRNVFHACAPGQRRSDNHCPAHATVSPAFEPGTAPNHFGSSGARVKVAVPVSASKNAFSAALSFLLSFARLSFSSRLGFFFPPPTMKSIASSSVFAPPS